jgi:hypothetical protein
MLHPPLDYAVAKTSTRDQKLPPSFVVHPLYSAADDGVHGRVGIGYAFNERLAIPDPYRSQEERAVKRPESFKAKTAVVLDLTFTCKNRPLLQEFVNPIVRVEVFASDRTKRLARFEVGSTCARSTTSKMERWRDRGMVHTSICQLRMPLNAELYIPLFSQPSQEIVVVALDAQGRTTAVQTITGHASEDALFVDGRLLSFTKDTRYGGETRFCDWTFEGTLTFDAPVSQPLETDSRSRTIIPALATRPAPMVLDLFCKIPSSSTRARPIKAITSIYVFDEDSVLLHCYDTATSGVYSQGADTGWGADRSAFRYEHLRIGMSEKLAAPLKANPSRGLRIIAVDTRYRTVMTAFPNG